MVFNSYTFVIFFAMVMLLHSLPLSWKVKKLNLLLASYLFYAAWNPPFVLLLWLSTLVDWTAAGRIHTAATPRARKAFLWLSLSTNLGLLGFFKYYGFLVESFVELLALGGVAYAPPKLDIVLPVGISFYTFQTLSYTLDVYRGKLAPSGSFLDFALYVTFFPQLVAGPIVRASEFLPSLATPRRATGNQFGWGLCLLVLGLFQKVVLADSMFAPVVERTFDEHARNLGTLAAWCGTCSFAGQIFCDFAGYSTCAIGVAMCLGFALPDNFRFPYASRGFSDFWKRWHISLSSWLRDYLYIPLGGNRVGVSRTHVNLLLTMLLGGLWHGASWTFVAWGGLHGLFLIAERRLRASPLAKWRIWTRPDGALLTTATTFAGVCLAWVFFRAQGFGDAFRILGSMFGFAPVDAEHLPFELVIQTLVPLSLIVVAHVALRERTLEGSVQRCPAWALSMMLALMCFSLFVSPGAGRAFLYFQF